MYSSISYFSKKNLVKVLLVANPGTVMGFNRLTRLPNLGLASLAANVDEGMAEVRIADLVLRQKNPEKALLKILGEFNPQVVGFSAMSFQYQRALELIQSVKAGMPGVKILLGGYHATADGENILSGPDHRNIDFIIDGEGEFPFAALLRAMNNGHDFEKVPGIMFRRNGHVVRTPRERLLFPEEIKLPRRDARIFQKGFHILGQPGDVIETSRGCVYDCNFCSIRSMYGKSFRKFSVARILSDLEDAKRFGAKSIFITDDNITLDGNRLSKLFTEIRKARLNLTFAIQASVSGFKKTPGLVELLAQAGTRIVFLGIENASDTTLEFMHKSNQMSAVDTTKVVAELKRFGIIVVGGFILGHPDDNKQALIDNFDFAKKLQVDIQLFNILTPHLCTELRNELMDKGFVTNPDDYSKYNHYAANVKTRFLSAEELHQIRDNLDARFPVESGAIFRLIKAYPWFFSALILKMMCTEPGNWVKFVTGSIIQKKKLT
jgi:anaerobic magnesium-protoporphyrin IX monomethyl ester cyclase